MKKEHFDYVSEHFSLIKYDSYNSSSPLYHKRSGVDVASCVVYKVRSDNYTIKGIRRVQNNNSPVVLFTNLPSKEFAKCVLCFIKDTEILFL